MAALEERRHLEILQSLPPTVELIAARVRVQCDIERLELAKTEPFEGDEDNPALKDQRVREINRMIANFNRRMEKIESDLDLGDERDRLQAQRPDGCWCMGLGGRGEKFVPDFEGGGIPVPATTCDACGEGQAAAAEKDRICKAAASKSKDLQRTRYRGSLRIPEEYADATLDTYPVTVESAEGLAICREYADSCDEKMGDSLIIWGLQGRGKTGLAISVMRELVERFGYDALFITVPSLLRKIKASYNKRPRKDADAGDGELESLDTSELEQQLAEVAVLVLDDIGTERPNEWTIESLYNLINERHNHRRRTIFTSNMLPSEVADRLGPRIGGRIMRMCQWRVPLEGPNLRETDDEDDEDE